MNDESNKTVMAIRDKILYWLLFVSGVLLCLLSIFMLSISKWYIVALIFGITLFFIGLYTILLPSTAIEKDGNYLIVRYLFTEKVILISDIEYVSYDELGTYARSEGGFSSIYTRIKDMRRLTITYRMNGMLIHSSVFICDASAVKSVLTVF